MPDLGHHREISPHRVSSPRQAPAPCAPVRDASLAEQEAVPRVLLSSGASFPCVRRTWLPRRRAPGRTGGRQVLTSRTAPPRRTRFRVPITGMESAVARTRSNRGGTRARPISMAPSSAQPASAGPRRLRDLPGRSACSSSTPTTRTRDPSRRSCGATSALRAADDRCRRRSTRPSRSSGREITTSPSWTPARRTAAAWN